MNVKMCRGIKPESDSALHFHGRVCRCRWASLLFVPTAANVQTQSSDSLQSMWWEFDSDLFRWYSETDVYSFLPPSLTCKSAHVLYFKSGTRLMIFFVCVCVNGIWIYMCFAYVYVCVCFQPLSLTWWMEENLRKIGNICPPSELGFSACGHLENICADRSSKMFQRFFRFNSSESFSGKRPKPDKQYFGK